jgi:hypothetical protein
VAGFFAYYMHLGLKENSPVQNPEKLHRETGFVAFTIASGVVFVLLMFTQIPILYDIFNVELAKTSPLWTLGPWLYDIFNVELAKTSPLWTLGP